MAKLTPKQESFCLSYIETGNASEAYRLNYDTENMKPATVNRNAKALLDNNKITTRLVELQAEHRERHDITVDSITEMYIADREDAREAKQYASAITAVTGLAKLHGLIVDRVKSSVTVQEKTDEELDQALKELGIDPTSLQVAQRH